MTEPLSGGCHCGAIRFTLGAPPAAAAYCHCTRCQSRTGTGSSVEAGVDGTTFELVTSEDLVGLFQHPDGGWEKGFCTTCGGHLFSRNRDDHSQLTIRMGAFDEDPGVRPSYHQFVAYAAKWEPVPEDGLPRYDERGPMG